MEKVWEGLERPYMSETRLIVFCVGRGDVAHLEKSNRLMMENLIKFRCHIKDDCLSFQ